MTEQNESPTTQDNDQIKIARKLVEADKKVQLIYALNLTGETPLSRALIELVGPKPQESEDGEPFRQKILYYNAYTEDLFYWGNGRPADDEPKLKIQPNSLTDWIPKDQVQDFNIITNFQRNSNDRLTRMLNEEYNRQDTNGNEMTVNALFEVPFSMDTGGEDPAGNFKISKSEDRNFICSVFYTLLDKVFSVLDVAEPEDRTTDQFNQLEYVFIDGSLSSLDESHLIELAVSLAGLVKGIKSERKFVRATYNPLVYNVLNNEFQSNTANSTYRPRHSKKYQLVKREDGRFVLQDQPNDRPSSCLLSLMSELQSTIGTDQIRKYHFNFMRNVLEKTSTFLGHKNLGDLLPKTSDGFPYSYMARIINLSSHSEQPGEEMANPTKTTSTYWAFFSI